jgi:zinc D-Ala-D-Ala dipeptidase
MTVMARLRRHRITGTATARALASASAVALACVSAPPAPPVFVDAARLAPDLVVEMRYASADNFVGARIDGYESARCLLSEPAARALALAQTDLAAEGLGLVAFDCYRPQRAVDHFVRWSEEPADPTATARYHPHVAKEELFAQGYVAERSGHSRGSTVDVGLVRAGERVPLDCGTPFDFFDPLSHHGATGLSEAARANRARLRAAMERRGFVAYPPEWWHYTLAAEPYSDAYFDVPVR